MDVLSSLRPVGPDAATLADIASFESEVEKAVEDVDNISTVSSDFPEFVSLTRAGPSTATASTTNPAVAGPSSACTRIIPAKRPRDMMRDWLDTPIKKTCHANSADGTSAQPIYIDSGDDTGHEADNADREADDMVL